MIAVFDLDHTLISANSSYCFGAFLFKRGEMSLLATLRLIAAYATHKAGLLSLRNLHQYSYKILFHGRSAKHIHYLAEAFLDQELTKLLDPQMLVRLQHFQYLEIPTHLMSSSPGFLVDSIARRLNMTQSYSTQYRVNAEGNFDKINQLVTGTEKARQIEQIKDHVIAFSDSNLDAPMLLKADTAICVKPDWRLRRMAKQRGWEII